MNHCIYREVHPPTGVTHCQCAHFTSSPIDSVNKDLIVAKSTRLEIYVVRNTKATEEDESGCSRLELLASYPLWGVVEDMAVLTHPSRKGGVRDALVLAFRDAKVCVLQWDEVEHCVRTTSMHYLEGDDSLKEGRTLFPSSPRIATDPAGRCAAVIFFRHQLALLPAMEAGLLTDLGVGGTNSTNGSSRAATVGNSYVINLSKLGIKEVRAATFLHGYTEPVLLILHEVEATSAARYRDKKDTCALAALSINLARKRHATIWTTTKLPSDAFQVVAAPRGSVLVLCPGVLLLCSQSTMTGVAVNRFYCQVAPPPPRLDMKRTGPELVASAAALASQYALLPHPDTLPAALRVVTTVPDLHVDLSGAACSWLSPNACLMALASGQLLLVQLRHESGQVKLQVSLTGATVDVASCLGCLGRHLLFLGSWSGCSMLLSYKADLNRSSTAGNGSELKKRRLDVEDERGNIPFLGADDDEDLMTSTPSVEQSMANFWGLGKQALVSKYNFAVLDSLMVAGPVRDLITLDGVGADANKDASLQKPSSLMAACIGAGASGALLLLRQGVTMDTITEVPIQNATGIWALNPKESSPSKEVGDGEFSSEGAQENGGANTTSGNEVTSDPLHHSIVLIGAASSSTLVLQCDGELMEEITDRCAFITDDVTIAAGTIFNGACCVQITPDSVVLVSGPNRIQQLSTTQLLSGIQAASLQISAATVLDPYILLIMQGGMAVLLEGEAGSQSLGLFTRAMATLAGDEGNRGSGQERVSAAALYRDECGWLQEAAASTLAMADAVSTETSTSELDPKAEHKSEKHTHYLIVARESCAVQIFALPTMALVFSASLAGAGERRLISGSSTLGSAATNFRVTNIKMECFQGGPNLPPACTRPVLVALLSPTSSSTTSAHTRLLVYQAFKSSGQPLSFCRLNIDWLPHAAPTPPPSSATSPAIQPTIIRFDNICSSPGIPLSGFLVTGPRPLWLVAAKGGLVAHPFNLTGPVSAFSPFHNACFPNGFMVAVANVSIAVAVLPQGLRLDTHWVSRRLPLRATPQRLAWYAPAQLLAMLVSRMMKYRPRLPTEPGGDMTAAAVYSASDARARELGREDGFEVRLFDSEFRCVHTTTLPPSEMGTALRGVLLKDTTSGSNVNFLAIGTSCPYGEDYPCLGRILLYDVVNTSSSGTEGASSSADLKQVYCRELQGPIVAIDSLRGCLLLAVANRVELYSWNGRSIIKCAFFDAPLLVSSMNVIKDFILLGDIHHSVWFLRYKEQGRQMQMLGRDFDARDITLSDYLINGTKLGLIAGDGGGSLRLLAYSMDDPAAWGGRRLLQQGVLYTGHTAAGRAVRAKMAAEDGSNRHVTAFGTLDGSYSFVTPVWNEKAYERLSSLSRALVGAVPHVAGLNPKAFRRQAHTLHKAQGGGEGHGAPTEEGVMLDGDLLMLYQWLGAGEQASIAEAAGTTADVLLADLADLMRSTLTCF